MLAKPNASSMGQHRMEADNKQVYKSAMAEQNVNSGHNISWDSVAISQFTIVVIYTVAAHQGSQWLGYLCSHVTVVQNSAGEVDNDTPCSNPFLKGKKVS